MFHKIDISIGGVVVTRLHPYIHTKTKAETFDRTLDESLFINRRVNSEEQMLTKYHFEFLVVEGEDVDEIELLSDHIGNHNFIDYYEIPEIFSGDGTTDTWTLRRPLASASYLPVIVVDDVSQAVAINELTNPTGGNVFVNQTTGVMTFGSVPTDADDNVKVLYVPVYPVHIVSCEPEKKEAGLDIFKVICEEV